MGTKGFTFNYHNRVREYPNETLPGQWIGRRCAVEYSPRSPDLNAFGLYPWGTLKDVVYRQKPRTIGELRECMEYSCADIKLGTLQSVVRAGVQRHRLCEDINGDHFQHLHH